MSDDPTRPEDEERPTWAPFGMEDEPPRPPEGPLWSGGDPVAAEPPAPEPEPEPPAPAFQPPKPPPAFEPPAPPPVADRAWPPAQPAPPPAPPAPGPVEGWPPPSPAPAAPRTSGNAQAALVLGAIGIFVCPIICSVAAIVLGVRARHEIEASGGTLAGRGIATAGLVLGVFGLFWFVVILAVGFGGALGPIV